MQNEVLLDIATFLIRRWPDDKNIKILITDKPPSTDIYKHMVSLSPIAYFSGSEFIK